MKDWKELLRELFRKPALEFTDAQAIETGVLVPFVVSEKDSLHRMTTRAWQKLTEYHRRRDKAAYSNMQFYQYFLSSLLPLVAAAVQVSGRGEILKTDYEFRVTDG